MGDLRVKPMAELVSQVELNLVAMAIFDEEGFRPGCLPCGQVDGGALANHISKLGDLHHQ